MMATMIRGFGYKKFNGLGINGPKAEHSTRVKLTSAK
jgi:hypothetical protein